MTTRIEGDYAYLYFVNSTFEKSEKVATYPNRTSQSDLVVIDSSWCNTSDRLMEDSFGNIHKGWARLDAWYDAYILYNLDKFEESNKIIDCLIEKEESAKNYCLKAKILYEMDDYENALMFVNKALDLKPDCKQAIELKEKIETL